MSTRGDVSSFQTASYPNGLGSRGRKPERLERVTRSNVHKRRPSPGFSIPVQDPKRAFPSAGKRRLAFRSLDSHSLFFHPLLLHLCVRRISSKNFPIHPSLLLAPFLPPFFVLPRHRFLFFCARIWHRMEGRGRKNNASRKASTLDFFVKPPE